MVDDSETDTECDICGWDYGDTGLDYCPFCAEQSQAPSKPG